MRAFLYARDSMDEIGTEREQNPEAQFMPMREECKRRNWENAGEFTDLQTGQEMYRPDFKRMLELAAAGQADLIMVRRADRFSRFNPIEALLVVEEIKQRGLHFYSIEEPFASSLPDNPVPEDYRTWLLHLSFVNARDEAKKISQRTKDGIAAKREKGEWKGGRPKGSQDKKPRQSPKFKPNLSVEEMFKPQ